MLTTIRKKGSEQKRNTRFEINPKSIYTSRNEGFDENSVIPSRKKLLPLAGLSGFDEQECSSLKIDLHLKL